MSSQGQEFSHRSRIYQLNSKGLREGHEHYIVANDMEEDPIREEELPSGEAIFTAVGSLDFVEQKIENFCGKLGEIDITDWRDLGSI